MYHLSHLLNTSFFTFQIHSYETAAENDEVNLLKAPFIKELCQFVGVPLQLLESTSREHGQTQRQMYHGKVFV